MIISPLKQWIERKQPLPARFYSGDFVDIVDESWSSFIGIEECNQLYEVNDMSWISLNESRKKTKGYLKKASKLINGLSGAWLDREESLIIKEKIHEPPIQCLPIYIITIRNKKNEEIVYIGKTETVDRFVNGHKAALKLLNTKYKQYDKLIYRCSIWFHFNNEYIAIDWIEPDSLVKEIIDSVESQLINHFKPELNQNKIKKNYTKFNFYFHIQNFCDNHFLNDTFIN